MACQSHYNLSHVRWVKFEDRQRVLTTPMVMKQKLHGKDEVSIAFGLKAENGVVTEVVQAAGLSSKGWWGGWNWNWVTKVVQGEVMVRIYDLKGKFIYQGFGDFFNLEGSNIKEKLLTSSAAFAEYQHFHPYTYVPKKFMLCATSATSETWCVIANDTPFVMSRRVSFQFDACVVDI